MNGNDFRQLNAPNGCRQRPARARTATGHLALALAATALATAVPPRIAFAASEPLAIEEVVVTARRREETAQDVPIAITALQQELQQSIVRNLADLNGFAPNVRIDSDPGRNNGASVTIRGISPSRTDDNSFDTPIAVMIDDIYLGSLGGQLLENFDLERVEILRGPQGTLFGRNTVGGVLNVIRSRPTGELGARAKISIGRFDNREYRFVGNAPIVEDKLAVKGFFTLLENDGYIRNTFLGGRQPEKDYMNFGATALFTPTDDFEALLTIEKFDDDSSIGANLTNFNLAPGVVPPPDDPNRETDLSAGFVACLAGFTPCRTDTDVPGTINTNIKNPANTEVEAYTLRMDYDINDQFQLVSITGYRDMVEDRKFDFDGSSGNYIDIERDNDYDQFSQELRFEGTWEKVSFVTGVYYFESEFTQNWTTGGIFWSTILPFLVGDGVNPNPLLGACFAGAFGNIACDSGAPATGLGPNFVQRLFETQKTEAIATFAQADWNFADRWTATAGWRWTKETKDFVAGQAYLAPLDRAGINNFPGFADLNAEFNDVSIKLGLSFEWSDDVLFYGSYAEGFHSGGFFGVNQNIADFVRDQYDPEFAETYEIGMKSRFFDRRVQLNLALFRNDFADKQESSIQIDPSTNTVATVFDNVASATYQGVEAEGQWLVNEYVSVFATLGYLDAEYDSFTTDITPNDGVANFADASFLQPRNAPKYTWGIGGSVTIPVATGRVEGFLKYDWTDEVETSLLNIEAGRVKSRENLNASIAYVHQDRYTVTLFGRNLTDEEREFPTIIQPLFASGTLIPPRTWGLEFEVNLQ